MKKFIKKTFAFSAFAAVTYPILLMLWGSFPLTNKLSSNLNYRVASYGHLLTRLQEVKQVKNVDILFLGSSRSYRGFDPRIFEEEGFSSFNLGSSSQTPIQTKLLLNRYLDEINPKVIIYEVLPGSLSSDGVESSSDVIANADYGPDILQMVRKQNHTMLYHTLGYALISELLGFRDNLSEPRVKEEDTYIEGGYVESELTAYEPLNYGEIFIEIEEKQILEFEGVLEIIKEKNIPYVLVFTPVTKKLYDSYSNFDVYSQKMSEHGTFLNSMELFELGDEKYFYDDYHLNQNGVELFNTVLIETITDPESQQVDIPAAFAEAVKAD